MDYGPLMDFTVTTGRRFPLALMLVISGDMSRTMVVVALLLIWNDTGTLISPLGTFNVTFEPAMVATAEVTVKRIMV